MLAATGGFIEKAGRFRFILFCKSETGRNIYVYPLFAFLCIHCNVNLFFIQGN